jgi:hypothetical protein
MEVTQDIAAANCEETLHDAVVVEPTETFARQRLDDTPGTARLALGSE